MGSPVPTSPRHVTPTLSRRRFLTLAGLAGLSACTSGGPDPADADGARTGRTPSSPSPTVSALETPAGFPEPIAWAVSRWSQDPFALGAYSFLAVGASSDDREALAAPVAGRLFFAGEATHVDFPATVHGALLSGRRAAAEVAGKIDPKDGRVVVIGAGAAGLGAAVELDAAGFDLVILEARDRVGGRLHTVEEELSVPVDLGASWIHGVEGNPVTGLAAEAALPTAAFDYDDVIAYDASGEEFQPDVDGLLDRLELRPGASIEDAVAAAQLGDVEGFDLAIAGTIEHEIAADARDIDGAGWDEGEALDGGDALVLGAYELLAEHLADGLDVRFAERVRSIAIDGDQVIVATVGGAAHGASAVVVTVPLGVLQSGALSFEPPLPAEKTAAIARLGSGALAKAVLEFDTVFWDDVLLIDLAGRKPRTQWTEFLNLEPFTGQAVIMGFSAGDAARAVERLTPEVVAASATAALASVYG